MLAAVVSDLCSVGPVLLKSDQKSVDVVRNAADKFTNQNAHRLSQPATLLAAAASIMSVAKATVVRHSAGPSNGFAGLHLR